MIRDFIDELTDVYKKKELVIDRENDLLVAGSFY